MSLQNSGKNNPMYGINVETLLTNELIINKRQKQKNTWKNKSQDEINLMILKLKSTMKAKSKEELQKIYNHHSKLLLGKKENVS